MWWARSSPPIQAWLSDDAVAWARGDGRLHWHRVDTLALGVEELVRWWRRASKPKLCLWLGGSLCLLKLMPAIAGARDREDAETALAAWLLTQGDPSMHGRSPRMGAWPCQGSQWPVALVKYEVMATLEARFAEALISVRPWWSWAMASRGNVAPGEARCAFDGQMAVLLARDATGEFTHADTAAPMTDEGIERWLRRRLAPAQWDARRCLRFSLPDAQEGDRPSASDSAAASSFAFESWVHDVR